MIFFLLFALAVAWAVMLLFGGMELDRALLLLAYAGERPELARWAALLTELGGGPVLIPVTGAAALWLLIQRRWRSAATLLGATISGSLFVDLQKERLARLRPEEFEHLVQVYDLSFPSAHAANSALVYVTIALLLARSPRARGIAVWGAVWLSLAIGMTRMILGVHWPSDVIGGWIFGLFWALLLLRLSGHALDEGTPPPVRHSFREGESDERREQTR